MAVDQTRPPATQPHRLASPKGAWTATALLAATILLLPGASPAECELAGPQKIVIDSAHQRLLVSNNDTGDITQIDSEGILSCFVQAAGFIDGMEIKDNTVFGVASGRRILGYDLDTRLRTMTATIPGTSYLSSIVADQSGNLYISCPLRNEIYRMRLSDQSCWTFVGGNALNRPNGMIVQESENRLVVIEDRVNPRIMAVSLADSSVTTLATTTLGGGDGIAQDMAGYYYVTGYYLPGVYRFDPSFTYPPVQIHEGAGIVYPTYDATDNTLLVTCYNTNSWLRLSLELTDVRSSTPARSLLLLPGRPNPFSPATSISFRLAAFGHTRLDVYNVLGRSVRTLVNEGKGPGEYSVTWDGTSDSGVRMACGPYYFHLTSGGIEQTQRVTLAR